MIIPLTLNQKSLVDFLRRSTPSKDSKDSKALQRLHASQAPRQPGTSEARSSQAVAALLPRNVGFSLWWFKVAMENHHFVW